MGQQYVQLLQQYGFAVVPELADAATLEAMRCESAALLEVAESADCNTDHSEDGTLIAERLGCIFQVLPEVARAPAVHPARLNPHTYWPLRTSWPYSAVVASFIQSKLLQSILQECLGTQPSLLFNEQYIIKPPHSKRSSFSWHCDSQRCGADQGVRYSPYLSLWVALDDMTADNGCLVVQPKSHRTAVSSCTYYSSGNSASPADGTSAGSRRVRLQQAPALETHTQPNTACTASCCSNHQAARQQPVQYIAVSSSQQLRAALSNSYGCCCLYEVAERQSSTSANASSARKPLGHTPGGQGRLCRPLGLLVPAGSAVLFWDTLWHCSGPNTTRYTRTAHMAQFSSRPLVWDDSGQPVGLAVPL